MFVLLLTALVTSATPTTPDGWLATLGRSYRRMGDFEAAFSQSYTDKLRPKPRVESGMLTVKADGRVRWSYLTPVVKDFVFDGKTAYFYEPENAQVTVFERFEQSPLWSALRFLWGQGAIDKTFTASVCGDCRLGEPGDVVLGLTPREPMPSVARAELAIDAKNVRVRAARVFDPLGNRTDYVFSGFRTGLHIDAARFAFEIPAGVSVLRPASEAP